MEGENEHRNDFMINLHESYVVELGFKVTIPEPVGKCTTNYAMKSRNTQSDILTCECSTIKQRKCQHDQTKIIHVVNVVCAKGRIY